MKRILSNSILSVLLIFCGITTVLTSKTTSTDQKCRALVLSGGANHGAYQAGVLSGMADLLPDYEIDYDVVSGVSAGSINAGAVAVYPRGDPKALSDWLVDMWMNITTRDIYKPWPHGFIDGVFYKNGFFNDEPLVEFLQGVFAQFGKFSRHVSASAVDANTGDYIPFNDENTPFEEFPMRIVASSSMPFIFPHRNIGPYALIDGGSTWNANLVSAVEHCREMGFDDNQIILDYIECNHRNDKNASSHSFEKNAMDNFMRFQDVSKNNKILRDIYEFQRAFPNVFFRYFMQPSKPIPKGLYMLKFDKKHVAPMIDLGRADAVNIVNLGPGRSFDKANEWIKSPDVRLKHPIINDYIHLTDSQEQFEVRE